MINKSVTKEVLTFLRDRFKNLLKDRNIRNDIIEASMILERVPQILQKDRFIFV